MAAPSSVLAWRIPGTGEPGGRRVGHDGSDLAAAAADGAQLCKCTEIIDLHDLNG